MQLVDYLLGLLSRFCPEKSLQQLGKVIEKGFPLMQGNLFVPDFFSFLSKKVIQKLSSDLRLEILSFLHD